MAIALDDITRKKLILIKQIYQNAVVQTGAFGVIERIMAVIGFDLAVETVLKAAYSILDSSKPPVDHFQGLIQQVDNLLKNAGYEAIPDKANIQYIHSIRNDVQHKVKYPNESEISDCRTYARDFLRKIISNLWGQDFESISLLDMIKDPEIKRSLLNSETKIQQKDFSGAVLDAGTGLYWALIKIEPTFVGSLPGYINQIEVNDAFGRQASDSDQKNLYRSFEKMRRTVLFTVVGIKYSEYMRYNEIAGEIYLTMDNKAHSTGMKEKIEPKEAEYVLSYCADVILRIEAMVGEIEKPFGQDWFEG